MSKLLYIQASPRVARSHSIAVADAFVKSYRQSHPADKVVSFNLFTKDLPAFDEAAANAKYKIMHGQPHSKEEAQAWKSVETLIQQFKSADKYVFTVPMWNFGVPYRLKQYLDVILQPSYTFSFSPTEGYKGLVTGKPALAIYARGGEYGDGPASAGYDFQKRYMELTLGFMGFKDVKSIIVEPTLAGGPQAAQAKRSAAIAKAIELAKGF